METYTETYNGQWLPTSEGFSIPYVIHYIYFPILIFEKEPVFRMFSTKQGNNLVP